MNGALLGLALLSALAQTQEEDPLTRRLHLSGNADIVLFYGETNSRYPGTNFKFDNARLFLDVDLGENLRSGESLLVRDASFYAEWDIAREAVFQNTIGSLYVRFDELAGVDALHLKFGRFLVPFGEEYLRQSEARPENPLVSFSVADPYGWDEGALFFGPLFGGVVNYYLAVTNGDFGFNENTSPDLQIAGKLDVRPLPWLLVSGSGLHQGRLGNLSRSGTSAIEWSGNNPRSFGAGSSVPNYQDGVIVPDDPDARLAGIVAWEGDLVLRSAFLGQLRLAAGGVSIRSVDLASYDRKLGYGIAEGVLEARVLSADLDRLYFAARASRIGTGSPGKGYLLGEYSGGSSLGYNTRTLSQVGAGLGYRLSPAIILKAEYTWTGIRLVQGVDPSLKSAADRQNVAQIGVSLAF
jgi:hypothetical protein